VLAGFFIGLQATAIPGSTSMKKIVLNIKIPGNKNFRRMLVSHYI